MNTQRMKELLHQYGWKVILLAFFAGGLVTTVTVNSKWIYDNGSWLAENKASIQRLPELEKDIREIRRMTDEIPRLQSDVEMVRYYQRDILCHLGQEFYCRDGGPGGR